GPPRLASNSLAYVMCSPTPPRRPSRDTATVGFCDAVFVMVGWCRLSSRIPPAIAPYGSIHFGFLTTGAVFSTAGVSGFTSSLGGGGGAAWPSGASSSLACATRGVAGAGGDDTAGAAAGAGDLAVSTAVTSPMITWGSLAGASFSLSLSVSFAAGFAFGFALALALCFSAGRPRPGSPSVSF